jgi:TetR/AcrR family tetracycline transcriptional repressor
LSAEEKAGRADTAPDSEGTSEAATAPESEKNRSPEKGRGTSLTRERIVRSALEIVDRDGLRALSMRRLGAELGVDPMAAYYHVPNKEALLDAIVEAVMAEIDLGADDPAASTEERIMYAACAYRDVMLAHVNALPIVLSRGPSTPEAMRPVELLIGILRDAGLPLAQAMAGMNAIAATVRGTVAMVADNSGERPAHEHLAVRDEQFPAEEFPHLREAALCSTDFLGSDFEFGIRALARGLLAEAQNA